MVILFQLVHYRTRARPLDFLNSYCKSKMRLEILIKIAQKNSLFMVKLGKCPECKTDLEDTDVEEIHFKGKVVKHIAYRCKHCDIIIGFSSHNRLS